ncbi:MAG: DUF11 domain-containing protein, partial [Ketobacter sp.]|nr:DUF11 domain-containing protein [Ketobacter sp.]
LPATSATAEDDLKVAGLVFTKEFLGDPVIPGDTVTLRFTIDNIHPSDDATSITFTDSLSAVLPGVPDLTATLPPAVNTCGGSESGSSTSLTYTGGSLMQGDPPCTIEYEILVPAGAADGSYANVTSSLTATQGGAVTIDPATDDLTVNSNLLYLTKAFTDDPVAPGDPATPVFTLTNLDAGNAASDIDFTDDLDAALSGLTYDSLVSDDCGAVVGGLTTTTITVTGASLTAGGSCTIEVSLSVPGGAAAGIYPNTTSAVTGDVGGFAVSGDAAGDDLEIIQLLLFSKSFDGPTTATGMATLTFTITNPGTDTAIGIDFSDDLDAVISGLIAISLPAIPCGAGSSLTGISFLAFTGGELPPAGGMCSFDVDVLVPASATDGTFPNTTSDLFQNGLPVADPATADLTILPSADIAVTKDDGVTSAIPGGSVVYTIEVTNNGPSDDPSVSLTDTFPSALTCTYTSSALGGATGNTAAGSGDLAETLSMPAGSSVTYTATCAIDSSATGTLSNTATAAASVTDLVAGNDSATDGDTVLSPMADLEITKDDGVTSATPGGSLTYTIVATNNGPSDDPSVSVTDTFPSVLTCSYTSVASG